MLILLLKYWFLFGYTGEGGSFPDPLTPKEEEEALILAEQGDKAARDKLIEHNLRLVAHIAKKYANYHSESEDLISVGTIGLIKAVCSFDRHKGSKLGTYAARCIENEMLMCLRSAKKHRSDISLQDTTGTDKDGAGIMLQDRIADTAKSIEDSIEDKIQLSKVGELMKEVLTEREQQIIKLRYGLETGEEVTQREIAQQMGISRSYVSRIETAALKKLKDNM